MKLVSFWREDKVRLGIVRENGILDVDKAAKGRTNLPLTMAQAIAMGNEGLDKLAALEGTGDCMLPESGLRYAPVVQPGKMLCVGFNYHRHIAESNAKEPEFPILFSKFGNALAAHGETVSLPAVVTSQYDYEAELVVVMGREGRFIPEQEALDYVFGFTAGNDISARDLQFRSGQWLIGKSLDGFGPIGPCLVTRDAIDCNNLNLSCRVNGETRQSGNTNNMIFNCAHIIHYASQFMTLLPGDVIFTGTPEGVVMGMEKDKQTWLKPGDVVEVEIESIGVLRTPFGN